jgi:hypothetical protein
VADCAVIALMRGYYSFSPSFTEICQGYIDLVADYEKTDAFAEVVGQQERIDDSPAAGSTGADLAALRSIYHTEV